MNKHFYLILVGTVLIVFGLTLVVISSRSIYFLEPSGPISDVVPIKENSSADVPFSFYFPTQSSQVVVIVFGSSDLQQVLNPVSNYSSTLGSLPITITVFSSTKNMTATEPESLAVWGYEGYNAGHVFNIPDSWSYVTEIVITNPENYPVCWTVTVEFYQRIIVTEWLDTMVLGIVSVIAGAVTLAVAFHKHRNLKSAQQQKTN